MRITLFFLLFGIFFSQAATGYSQGAEFTLNLKSASIKEVCKEIEKNSDFIFVFSDDSEKMINKKVDVDANSKNVTEILDIIFFNTGLTYKILDKQIVVYHEKKADSKVIEEPTQQKTIIVTGVVLDERGNPLPGVTIIIAGSTKGVITDTDGNYSIEAKPTDKLTFSFIGLEPQTIDVNNQTKINVILKEKVSELEEVTVVAFGKQKKESVVASITTINPGELKIPSSNLTTALAGRMAGIIAYQRSGEPGQDNAEFFIRGVTTFGYKKDPLILIDNNESSTEDLARMQPDDIASFSILKDATASALYGSRGANGVILITTKGGHEGKAQINVRYEEAVSMPTRMVELADPITYMRLHNEAIKTRNPLGSSMYSEHKIANTIAGTNPYVYPTTDWYDILFKDYTNNHRLNFSVGGGGNIARYYMAGSVINDNGVLNVDKRNNFNSNVNLNRYTLRTNIIVNVSKTTEVIARMSGSFDDYSGPMDGGAAVFKEVMATNPVLFPPYYEPDEANQNTQHILFGNYDQGQYHNPYAGMVRGYKHYTTAQMLAQFELDQKLDFITQGLAFNALFNTSRYSHFSVGRNYKPFFYEVAKYEKKTDTYTLSKPINETDGTEYLGYHEGGKDITSTTYFESRLNWYRNFNEKHELGALLVFTLRNQLAANAGDLQKSLPYRNLNWAGRATYAYDSKYLFEFNFGYNGSERFSQKERFGFFPSIGTGWIISNENFYTEPLKKTINHLKLRATYGLSGNDAIGDANDRFFYLSNVNMDNGDLGSSFGTYGNAGGRKLSGISVSRYANEDITWETARKTNLALEAGFWGKVDLQVEFFKEKRTNILMERAHIPATMGLEAKLRANVGEAESQGCDLSLNLNHSFNKDFWITGMGNFTYATSKYLVYEEPSYPTAPWKSREGYSLNLIQGYIAERLFVDEEEVRNSPTQFGDYMAGDIKYKDLNGDGKINELDIAPIGYPSSPEIVYGFGLSTGWKQWDLSFFFQGLARESFYINSESTAPFIDGQNALIKAYADDHWSEDNRNIYALWPRLSPVHVENNNRGSTWFLRDGTFLRLKSLEFGYTLSERLASRIRMDNLRIYFSGTNLLTLSKFKLWDPEMAGEGLGYPVQKVFNIGMQLSF
ncbi:TonB-dependent receptor [uncultured Proteiniphilum sp.]|uniref:TonB-dependent receptor n=1 Tax=uncultured Proteiniphilum sp. TaxID=497637 RepID=UPI00260729D2|nr:TonB-dependent receptor [uncultured Proteiniphilum sp.]